MQEKHPKYILSLLFTGVLMGALDISIVGPAIPEISHTLSMPRESLSWVFTIYVLFNLAGLPLLARLSDVFGRKIVYVTSVALFAIGSVMVSLASGYEWLLTGRAIQGFGASGIFPVAAAVIGDIYPPEKRGKALGMIGAVFGIAFLIGPIMAGFVLKYYHWNTLFWVNVPVALLLIIGGLRILPSQKKGDLALVDWIGILLLSIFVSTFALALNKTNPSHFFGSLFNSPVIWLLGISIVSFIGLMQVERKAKFPVINLGLFSKLQVRLVGAIAFGTGIFQASFVFVPDFTVHAFHVASAKASFMLIPVVLATAIGSPVAGRMIDKLGSRMVVLFGIFGTGLGIASMMMVGESITKFYIAGIFIGFGLSMLAGPALRYIILNEVHASERAVTQGILTMFISLGQILGSAIIGAVTASFSDEMTGYNKAFLLLSMISLAMLFFAFRLKNKAKEQAEIRRAS